MIDKKLPGNFSAAEECVDWKGILIERKMKTNQSIFFL
jgi:hypothetical protein